jgi:hypothetical protein
LRSDAGRIGQVLRVQVIEIIVAVNVHANRQPRRRTVAGRAEPSESPSD